MAVPTISESFIEEFESGVHMAYQRRSSKLRGTVRTANGVANKTTFQKIGKGLATQKGRHASIPPMNLDHSNVNVVLEDWFAGEWVDDLDKLRINHDEMMVAQQSGAYALGRQTDQLILDAMNTDNTALTALGAPLTLATSIALMETFGFADIPDDGRRYAVISWEQWGALHKIEEFASADFIDGASPFGDQLVSSKSWLGFQWIAHSGLESTNGSGAAGTTHSKCFLYHADAIGHAIGSDVQTNIAYHNDKDSWFINNKMQMNAVTIDEDGVFKIEIKKA